MSASVSSPVNLALKFVVQTKSEKTCQGHRVELSQRDPQGLGHEVEELLPSGEPSKGRRKLVSAGLGQLRDRLPD